MDKDNEMKINEKGNVVVEFDEGAKFTLRTPPWPVIKSIGSRRVIEFAPDAEIHIAEAAILTGYTQNTLRQLEATGEIPAPTRLEDGSRVWRAEDVYKIRERRRRLRGTGR